MGWMEICSEQISNIITIVMTIDLCTKLRMHQILLEVL
jgi:hypothetical protein